jgi:hypothetical protein
MERTARQPTKTHLDAAADAAAGSAAARGRRSATWRRDSTSKRRAWVPEFFAPLPAGSRRDVGSVLVLARRVNQLLLLGTNGSHSKITAAHAQ